MYHKIFTFPFFTLGLFFPSASWNNSAFDFVPPDMRKFADPSLFLSPHPLGGEISSFLYWGKDDLNSDFSFLSFLSHGTAVVSDFDSVLLAPSPSSLSKIPFFAPCRFSSFFFDILPADTAHSAHSCLLLFVVFSSPFRGPLAKFIRLQVPPSSHVVWMVPSGFVLPLPQRQKS